MTALTTIEDRVSIPDRQRKRSYSALEVRRRHPSWLNRLVSQGWVWVVDEWIQLPRRI